MRRLAILVAAVLATTALIGCQPVRRPPSASRGMWIAPAHVKILPRGGLAWSQVSAAARSNWGSPRLSDQNADDDVNTLAGALVAVRENDRVLAAKVRNQLMAVTRVRDLGRVLSVARNITSYVIAADVIGLSGVEKARFASFLRGIRTRPLEGHSGGNSLVTTALLSPNNWGTMARAAITAIDIYIGDKAGLAQMVTTQRAWLGEPVRSSLKYTDTAWHAGRMAGVNPRGAVAKGVPADGVLPEDQRRTGEPKLPAAKGSYPWEALQGALVTSVLLQRQGLLSIHAGDDALARAFTWLSSSNRNAASGDDRWQPWVLNAAAGTRFAVGAKVSAGKNMAWTDWTYA